MYLLRKIIHQKIFTQIPNKISECVKLQNLKQKMEKI